MIDIETLAGFLLFYCYMEILTHVLQNFESVLQILSPRCKFVQSAFYTCKIIAKQGY